MKQVIEQICAHIHNYFETDPNTGARRIHQGRYTITNGSISLPFLREGQYFRLFGSTFDDGVHIYPESDLHDETFDGVVWDMRPPRDFLDLVDRITDWVDKYGEAAKNPYQSENVIGVYSYQKGDGHSSSIDNSGWQSAFRRELNAYRRLA